MFIVGCTKVATVGNFTESNTLNRKDRFKVETELPDICLGVYSYLSLFSISDIA